MLIPCMYPNFIIRRYFSTITSQKLLYLFTNRTYLNFFYISVSLYKVLLTLVVIWFCSIIRWFLQRIFTLGLNQSRFFWVEDVVVSTCLGSPNHGPTYYDTPDVIVVGTIQVSRINLLLPGVCTEVGVTVAETFLFSFSRFLRKTVVTFLPKERVKERNHTLSRPFDIFR